MEITIKNYRCFEDTKPVTIEIKDGFTAFIGPNNSGKSTLLRFFYEFRHLFVGLSAGGDMWSRLVTRKEFYFDFPPEVVDFQQIFCNTNERPLEIQFLFPVPPKTDKATPSRLLITMSRSTRHCIAKAFTRNQEITLGDLDNHSMPYTHHKNGMVVDWSPVFALARTLANTLYVGPFRNAISLMNNGNAVQLEQVMNLHQKYFDIDVGPGLITQWRELSTGTSNSAAIAALNVASTIQGIFGFNNLSIQAGQKDRSIKLFIDNKSRFDLHEVGSGIGQFFAVLANAAIKKPSYILIDEPELNLHPSLQLDFLTTLGKYAPHGVVFSTHSIGLARASADRIYTVRKKQGSSTEVVRYEKKAELVELLGEMSFSTYREFGFDKVLLVEGVTEVKTIQQFLRKYHKDHEVLLLPLGGSAMINGNYEQELRDVFRISSRVYALIDSERNAQGAALHRDRQQFVDLCTSLKIHCTVLERRATENYLTDQAVKLALGPNFEALGPYQKLDTARNGWSKSSNWRIADRMDKAELEATDLGQFILEVCKS